MFSYKKAATR